MPAFNKILIANRGEIACRIIGTAQALGYRTVAVYSQADAQARHVQMADEAVCIGPAQVGQSYLQIDNIIAAAQKTAAEAIHPGYGFLSENADFARACEAAGITFIGPSIEAIHLMGSKRLSKVAMLEAGVPCIPGYEGAAQDQATLHEHAQRIGYPLMIKASAGGGGRGMRLVQAHSELDEQLNTARSEALNAFGSGELILERAVLKPRHVEIQVFGDQHGNLVYLGERDCSVQRRHQKVVEEAPCPVMTQALRQAMGEAAVKAAASVNYVGAGTVEFLLDQNGDFYFLEMNTRLQVEHPVTELVTGQDLVAWQISVAQGEPLPLKQDQIRISGHAMEVRLYAEDPAKDFLPQTGTVMRWRPALLDGIRIDHGVLEGQAVSAFYDPMLAKIIAYGATRDEARRKLARAVEDCVLLGVKANQRFLANLLRHPQFASGNATTAFIGEHFSQDPSLTAPAISNKELALASALFYHASATYNAQQAERSGWSNSASAELGYVLELAESTVKTTLTLIHAGQQPKLRISLEQQSFELQLLSADGENCTVEIDGVRQRLCYQLHNQTLHLFAHSGSVQIQNVTHKALANTEAAGSGSVKAPMDGAIVEVLVEPGSPVSKGQLLLVLEAMKMEHPLKASIDGVVSRVQATPGEQVKNRQLLVEIQAHDATVSAN